MPTDFQPTLFHPAYIEPAGQTNFPPYLKPPCHQWANILQARSTDFQSPLNQACQYSANVVCNVSMVDFQAADSTFAQH